MKKALKYIYLAGLVSILASCINDPRIDGAEPDDDGLYLTMSLAIPEMRANNTRGVLDDVTKNPHELTSEYMSKLSLYMFVFEDAGSPEGNYLRSLVHGEDITPLDDDFTDDKHSDKILRSYKAKVDGTSENVVIHLVATSDPNFEEQLQNSTDRSELGLFYGSNGLYTRNEHPAFWKRIELGMPINEENKDEIQNTLSHVQMIRNFCRVTVRTNDAPENANKLRGFQVLGFALVNQVNCGYVAAYSENEPRGFVEFETTDKDGKKVTKSYGDILTEDKYIPSRHPMSVREHKEEDASWLPADGVDDSNIFSNSHKYMFERPYQSQHHTFVVIKGCFDGNKSNPRYIKLDIGDIPVWLMDPEEGFVYTSFEYQHLYRNFSYDIVINTVASKDVGASTASAALAGPATNNIGAAVETQPITDISDGIDRMWVNETKFVIVDDDKGNPFPASFDLMWRYVTDWQGIKRNDTKYINCLYPGMELEENDDSGIFKSLTAINLEDNKWPDGWETDTYGGWMGKTIKFNKPDEDVRQKTVRLYYSDPSTNKPNVRLSRDITFVMRQRWAYVTDNEYESNIEVYPGAYSYENNTMPYESLQEMRSNITPGYVGSQRGAQLTVMFELPADLPEALFPLDFKIGFDRQNVESAYAGNAVMITGPSMFEDVDVMRQQFVKTVTWDYYHGSGDAGDNGHKIVTVRFITTNDVIDESGFDGADVNYVSKTRVRITNPYFTLGSDTFERGAHDDVVDPTRTHWLWNFSYPEWGTYFNTYAANSPDNPHNLNNLSFVNYTQSSTGFGNYMAIGQDNKEADQSEDATKHNPEYSFPVEFSTSDYSGELIVKAQVDKGRDNQRVTGRNGLGIANRWGYDLYDRDVHAAVVDENNNVYDLVCTSDGNRLYHRCTQNDGSLRNPVDCKFSLSNAPADTKIKEIRIWSVRTVEYSTANYDYVVKAGKTRYYSIEFTLTAK